jgi:hypothetical protein
MSEKDPFIFPTCILHSGLSKSCVKQDEIRSKYSEKNVFVNIPYVHDYASLEISIWSTLKLYGYTPIMARDERTHEIRLCRICRYILSSKFCVTDFTDKRLNVALEYGLSIAAGKLTISLVDNKYDLDKEFSDVKFIDPIGHNKNPNKLSQSLSEWIESNTRSIHVPDKLLIQLLNKYLISHYEQNYSYDLMNQFYNEAEILYDELLVSMVEELGDIRK